MNNLNIYASASISGGNYNKIRIFGAAGVTGDLTANELIVFGSASLNGKCDINNMSIHGACKFHDSVKTNQLDIKGSCKFLNEVKVDVMKVFGAVKFEEKVYRSKLIEIYGSVKTQTLEADKILIEGSIKCEDQLNADLIEISSRASCVIKEMVGSEIIVKPKRKLFTRVHSHKNYDQGINVEVIEGDEIQLENVYAKVVRGNVVRVGPNCIIEKIEYHESLEVDKDSKIKDSTKI